MKPIAWINEYDGLESFNPDNRQDWIPLYSHPADLTNQEIDNLIADVAEKPTDEDLYDFAKAILRKAQE
jgi:hypothetical protein